MADVFISYAREDRDTAQRIANALEAQQYTVWWDREILAGDQFDEIIERELDLAKSVIVLWSKYSVSSRWVRSEAAAASERNVLIPAFIEEVKLPLEFRRSQTIDLIGWRGDPESPAFEPIRLAISSRLRQGAPSTPPAPCGPRDPRADSGRPGARKLSFFMAVIALGLLISMVFLYLWQQRLQSEERDQKLRGLRQPSSVETTSAEPSTAHGQEGISASVPMGGVRCVEFQATRSREVACNDRTTPGYYWGNPQKQTYYSTAGTQSGGSQPPCNLDHLGETAMTSRFPYKQKFFQPVYQTWSNPAGAGPTAEGCNFEGPGIWLGPPRPDECGIFTVTCMKQPIGGGDQRRPLESRDFATNALECPSAGPCVRRMVCREPRAGWAFDPNTAEVVVEEQRGGSRAGIDPSTSATKLCWFVEGPEGSIMKASAKVKELKLP